MLIYPEIHICSEKMKTTKEILKEKFTNKELAVSFEIWSRDEEGNSVVTTNRDGNRVINPIIFHGCGILVKDGELPACPKAYAKKLIAMFNLNKKEEMDNLSGLITEIIFILFTPH